MKPRFYLDSGYFKYGRWNQIKAILKHGGGVVVPSEYVKWFRNLVRMFKKREGLPTKHIRVYEE